MVLSSRWFSELPVNGGIWTNRSLEGISFRLCNQINICHLQGDPDEPPKWLQPQWLEKGSEKAERTEVCHITYGRLLEILLLFFSESWCELFDTLEYIGHGSVFPEGCAKSCLQVEMPGVPCRSCSNNIWIAYNTGWINVHETHGPGGFIVFVGYLVSLEPNGKGALQLTGENPFQTFSGGWCELSSDATCFGRVVVTDLLEGHYIYWIHRTQSRYGVLTCFDQVDNFGDPFLLAVFFNA